jgi:hypothetical protein
MITIMAMNESRDVQISRLIYPPVIRYHDKEDEVMLNTSEIQLQNVTTNSAYRSKSNALSKSIYSINIKGFRGLHINFTV